MRKDLLKKLERANKDRAQKKELESIFLSNFARITAAARGEPLPPEHPEAGKDPHHRGTCFDTMTIAGGEPVEDRSEPGGARSTETQ